MFMSTNEGFWRTKTSVFGALAVVFFLSSLEAPVTDGLNLVSAAEAASVPSDYNYVVTRGTAKSSMPAPQGGKGNLDHHGFRFFCVPTHYSYDDPVVYPGQEGAAHLHMFFGNTDVDAHSTAESIINSGRTSCDGGITNRSAYWIPALFNEAGDVVLPTIINNYYKSWVLDRSKIRPIPAGLQILANDKVLGSSGVAVSAIEQEIWSATFRVFPHDGLSIEIRFPDCVAVDANGKPVLTSPGGTSHVAYSSGNCPASHPYTIPQLTQNLNWSGVPFESDWRFASDLMNNAPKGTTIHADYMAGWTPEAALIMSNCVRDGVRECGPGLHSHWEDQFFAPNGDRVYDYFKIADGVDPTPAALEGWPSMLMKNSKPVPTRVSTLAPAASRAEVMLYGNWPSFDSSNGYAEKLLEHRKAFEELRDQLNASRLPGQPPVYIIPSYEFISRVIQDLAAGNAVGISSVNELFSDNLHLSAIGNYGIASLAYATVFGRDPDEQPIRFNPDSQQVTNAQAAYLRDVAWDVAKDYGPAGLGVRTPTAPGTPHVFSGNSQTHGWLEFLYKPAFDSGGQSVAQSIQFGSTAAQRWAEAEQLGVQLPDAIGDYALVIVGLGPYFSIQRETLNAEANALRKFMKAAWAQGLGAPDGVAPSPSIATFRSGETIITTANLNLRASPGGEVLRVLPAGTIARVPAWSTSYAQNGRTWVGLTIDGSSGYVVSDYLEHH
ncbi:DUF1996 domain-containing protein [Sedimentitalea todarodis]|uniref:DUF1996 domain-containing protein n=1 Tax=Sedimentitalea todarodis TaxID=1631240 RepID=A0ABU3VG61_9RHOB|nr:DUF1996 domain-containing protein [Sedimentitalea todarodis]MDU9005172.1 DUF1996 domain-containing protein [Sedimentitalea todarodis]